MFTTFIREEIFFVWLSFELLTRHFHMLRI